MGWDGAQAEREIRKYAGDEDGKPIPSKAKQCYLKVTGDGTKWGDYSYPYVRIKNGEPVPDFEGLQAAWTYARRFDPQLLRKIITICRQEGFELTPAMADWAKRYMHAQGITGLQVVLEDDNEIQVRGIVMREGVFNGALQLYDEFVNDVPFLIGTPVLAGDHPRDKDGRPRMLEAGDPVVGEIVSAEAVPEKRSIMATWRIQKDRTPPEILEKIQAGEPVGTSLGYWCNMIVLDNPAKFVSQEGTVSFTKIERGPRVFDHVATPKRPACHTCGMLHVHEERTVDNKIGGEVMSDVENMNEVNAVRHDVEQASQAAVSQPADAGPQIQIQSLIDQIHVLSEEVERLKAAEAARLDAARKNEEESLRQMFLSWIKPGKETEADQLWEQAKPNPWRFRFEHPEYFVSSPTSAGYSPVGSAVVGRALEQERVHREDGLIVLADTGEVDWKAMGIKSPKELAKELGYTV